MSVSVVEPTVPDGSSCPHGHHVGAAFAFHYSPEEGEHFLWGHDCPTDGRYYAWCPACKVAGDGLDWQRACIAAKGYWR